MKYAVFFKNYIAMVERALEDLLPPKHQNTYTEVLHEAMRYSVLNGGKRFRPVLTLSACEAAGGKPESALIPAVSIELLHTYSLIHDDLPALDNDDERRGKPSSHKKFGEAVAILAGDSLLTLSLQLVGDIRPPKVALEVLREISTAAGTYGMIGGQIADLTTQEGELDLPTMDYINVHKTGKLIKASVMCGALVAGANKDISLRIQRYGENIGLAFQSVDDLLDGDGYVRLMKASNVQEKVRDLIAHAKKEIKPLGRKAEKLQALADYLLKRMPSKKNVSVDS